MDWWHSSNKLACIRYLPTSPKWLTRMVPGLNDLALREIAGWIKSSHSQIPGLLLPREGQTEKDTRLVDVVEHSMSSTTLNSASDVRSNSAGETLVQNWWLFTLRGILGVIFGCLALIFPGPTMLSLVIFFSAYMLVDGVAGTISAARAIRRKEDRWGLLIFEGLLNIAVGILAYLWPGITVVAFVWLVAAWAIVTGGLMTAAGFRLNKNHGRWWMVLGGLLSLAYGVLLIVTPLIGAIVLTWWIGAYALAFGIALIVFSFKLRSRQHERVSRTSVGTAA
jgi:uncharacterized membrane protein HdeD (DUF308 family)